MSTCLGALENFLVSQLLLKTMKKYKGRMLFPFTIPGYMKKWGKVFLPFIKLPMCFHIVLHNLINNG